MKTKLSNRTVAIIFFIVASIYGQALYAQNPNPAVESKKGDSPMMLPDLTDSQKEEIKKLKISNMKEILPLKNQLAEKKARLKTLTTVDKVDMQATNKIIEDIGGLKTEIMKLKIANKVNVRGLLTDEQRIIFDMRSHKPGKGKRHGTQGQGKGKMNTRPGTGG